jgi:hypothetical protein
MAIDTSVPHRFFRLGLKSNDNEGMPSGHLNESVRAMNKVWTVGALWIPPAIARGIPHVGTVHGVVRDVSRAHTC